MRLLADQNIPRHTVDALPAKSHDVLWAQTACPGAPDHVLLKTAIEEERVVLTFDKDFGTLAFHAELPAECGIILPRFMPVLPEMVTTILIDAIKAQKEWVGYFSVVEEERIRVRPLDR